MKSEEVVGVGIFSIFTIGFFIFVSIVLGTLQTYVMLDVVKLFELNFIKLTFIQMFGCLMLISYLKPTVKNDHKEFMDLLKDMGGKFLVLLSFWGLAYLCHWVLVVCS